MPIRVILAAMRRKLSIAAAVVAALVVAAQVVPVSRENPPVEAIVEAPPDVAALLHRACWDCHSRETVWAWHTRIAPISWYVAHDVSEGREEVDFTAWQRTSRRLPKLGREIAEEVGEGEMPPALYRLAHPAARLTAAEQTRLAEWGRTLAAGGPPGGAEAFPLGEAGEREGHGHGEASTSSPARR